MKVLYVGSNERKTQEKNKDKIEARFAERMQEMNSSKIKCENVKRQYGASTDGILRNGYLEC